MKQRDTPVLAELHASKRGFSPGAKVFLYTAKAYAIAFTGILALKLHLAFGAFAPHLML
ncbi:hypothetical protein D3C81_2064700 [compost metagenome]